MKIRQINFLHIAITIALIIIAYTIYFPKHLKYASNNTKILFVFNGEHYKEAANLLASMKKHTPELVPLIVICVNDNNGVQFAQQHNLSSFAMPTITESGEFMSRKMNIMTKRKFEGILHLLQLGNDVLYIDTDVVVMSDPFQDIDRTYDINIQDDECRPPYRHANLCTGFIFVQSNARTKKFFQQAIMHIINSDYKIDDQHAFNALLAQDKLTKKSLGFELLSLKILNACKYPNGCRYFGNTDKNCHKKQAIIIHNNYLIGMDNKIRRFKESGLIFENYSLETRG